MATNREWLNSLSDEEFAGTWKDNFWGRNCGGCKFYARHMICSVEECIQGRLAWLKQEHEEELKPCPFCGGEASLYPQTDGFWGIGCKKSSCRGYMPICYSIIDKRIATTLWNRRA